MGHQIQFTFQEKKEMKIMFQLMDFQFILIKLGTSLEIKKNLICLIKERWWLIIDVTK